jgi:hypothetical protein
VSCAEVEAANEVNIGQQAIDESGGERVVAAIRSKTLEAGAMRGLNKVRSRRPCHRAQSLTGAVLAAQASEHVLAELMARLGHSIPGAVMRYQHAAADRAKVIAEALSKTGT